MKKFTLLLCAGFAVWAADADLILHNGKILTVDSRFSVVEAMAVKGGRISAVGSSAEILKTERGSGTRVIDLHGSSVLPGLNDAHVHVLGAALSEFRQTLPPLNSISGLRR